MRYLAALCMLMCACTAPDPCEDWTWIDWESCEADVCAEQGQLGECIDGECVCYD